MIVALAGWIPILRAQTVSQLFSDTGQTALAQKKIDIHGGAVVLSIAIAPGFEDVPTLAYFRLKEGAVVACVYLTNGEDIPNAEYGNSAHETAKQRKEEAYTAMNSLNSEAYFLNIPARDFLSPEDSAFAAKDYFIQLDKILADVKPDIILLNSDYIFPNAASRRLSVIKKNIESALKRLKANQQWHDVKVFIQSDDAAKGELVHVDEVNSIIRQSYAAIADDVRRSYHSLKTFFPVWKNVYQPRYTSIYPQGSAKQKPSGSPVISNDVQKIAANIKEIAPRKNIPSLKNELTRLQNIVSQIDYAIDHEQNKLSLRGKRFLLYWKNTIESYRCVLHNVQIPYAVRNENVTALQVFFVNIGSLDSWIDRGTTQLMFPGVIQGDWILDTKQNYSYPLKPDTSWVIVSPKIFPLTSPANDEGYNALQVRTKFPFMAVHEESNSINNFVYQKDIVLNSVARQSIEILQPDVLANRDSMIVVRIKNNLFNAMDGEIQTEDSLVAIRPHHIRLSAKTASIDTLTLVWNGTCRDGEHTVTLRSKKNHSVGTFVYKGIDLQTGKQQPVGVITTIEQSPLLAALRRIGYPCVLLDSINSQSLQQVSIVILDGQSSKKIGTQASTKKQFIDWIAAGGKLIVLPQFDSTNLPMPDDSVTFRYRFPVVSAKEFDADTTRSIFKNPNRVEMSKWQNTESVIAYGDLSVKDGLSVMIPVTSQKTNNPLMVVRRYGQGTILYTAFNWHPELLSIQAEAYKFFVNMLN